MNELMKKLSKTIVDYALEVKKNDHVLIVTESEKTKDFVDYLIDEIIAKEATPSVKIISEAINAKLLEHLTEEQTTLMTLQKQFEVDNFDCFIQIRYGKNDYEDRFVSSEARKMLGKATEKIDDIRINERRWVLLNYPTELDAHKTKMPTDRFINYAWEVMNVDYKGMEKDLEPLKKLMEKTDEVRLTGPDTNLTFSIKGIPVIPCCGKANIPDGEIYTAPVRESVNGTITFNTPCPYQGNVFTNVSLTFKDGQIVNCSCNEDNETLKNIFDIDEGARYVGEFSFGLNPKILHPMGDILYDEKIIGSIHFTPGRCYDDASNGNASAIHWDMVLIQREDYGGGEVYFDGKLIRKDGLFILPELEHLNYHLK